MLQARWSRCIAVAPFQDSVEGMRPPSQLDNVATAGKGDKEGRHPCGELLRAVTHLEVSVAAWGGRVQVTDGLAAYEPAQAPCRCGACSSWTAFFLSVALEEAPSNTLAVEHGLQHGW